MFAREPLTSCTPFQDESTGEITFYMKGADVVMAGIVQYNDWLEEEVRLGQGLGERVWEPALQRPGLPLRGQWRAECQWVSAPSAAPVLTPTPQQ